METFGCHQLIEATGVDKTAYKEYEEGVWTEGMRVANTNPFLLMLCIHFSSKIADSIVDKWWSPQRYVHVPTPRTCL